MGKVQNLEYEHKESRRQVSLGGENSIQKEREEHSDRVLGMNKDKLVLKRDFKEQQLENEDDVKMMRQGFAKSLQKLRDQFEKNHRDLQETYEEQVEQLK